jgi:hypothetical protein
VGENLYCLLGCFRLFVGWCPCGQAWSESSSGHPFEINCGYLHSWG